MPISVSCKCGKMFSFADKLAGRSGKCKRCGRAISIPAAAAPDDHEKGFYEAYSSFSKTLRGWLVAFGMGAPVLFASQSSFSTVISNHGLAAWIILPYLAGSAIQIILCLFYKYSMFYLYCGEIDRDFRATGRYRASAWFSEKTAFEMILDGMTIGLYAFATVVLLFAMLK